jgi:hypothetical protein
VKATDKTCKQCGHSLLTEHLTGGGCTHEACRCPLNRAGQSLSARKLYARDPVCIMYVDPSLEYGPWNTKTGLL